VRLLIPISLNLTLSQYVVTLCDVMTYQHGEVRFDFISHIGVLRAGGMRS